MSFGGSRKEARRLHEEAQRASEQAGKLSEQASEVSEKLDAIGKDSFTKMARRVLL